MYDKSFKKSERKVVERKKKDIKTDKEKLKEEYIPKIKNIKEKGRNFHSAHSAISSDNCFLYSCCARTTLIQEEMLSSLEICSVHSRTRDSNSLSLAKDPFFASLDAFILKQKPFQPPNYHVFD